MIETDVNVPANARSVHSHVCTFHPTFSEQVRAASAFISQGFTQDMGCIIVTKPASIECWQDALHQDGFYYSCHSRNRPQFASIQAWLPEGDFSSIGAAASAWRLIDEALGVHKQLRLVVDMGWAMGESVPAATLCHWEATYDFLLSTDLPVEGLCQYSCLMPASLQHAALRTHPEIGLGSARLTNPHYEAPDILALEPALNDCSDNPLLLATLLAQLRPAA